MEALEAEWHMILMYQEDVITDYKAFIGFRRSLERSGVVPHQFGYQIILAHFKARYPKLELVEDSFINYLEDQDVSTVVEVPFDNMRPCPNA